MRRRLTARTAHEPRTRPIAAPPRARSRLSTRSWRPIRKGLAPRQQRTAISRHRAVARARSRLATFAQAMSSTIPTAPRRTSRGVLTSPTRFRASGSAYTIDLAGSVDAGSVRGFPSRSRQKSSLSRAISRAASLGVRPGASRASAVQHQQSRLSGSMPSGTQSSVWLVAAGKPKPGGMIPTTVPGRPSITTLFPTTPGSPPKRRCQRL